MVEQAASSQSIVEVLGHRLRDDIINGRLLPGQQLVEADLVDTYQVSRNSIREVLHQLVRDGLATSIRHRGVFVRTFCENDLADIYTARRVVQLQAIRCDGAYCPKHLDKIGQNIERAQLALQSHQWKEVGTLSLAFHQVLVQALGSRLITEFFLNICAQLRLIFTIGPNERIVQRPLWVEWEHLIHRLMCEGAREQAEQELCHYLSASQEALSKVVRKYQPQRRAIPARALNEG